MKANYMKPLLSIEMFSASQSGARDCADNIPQSQLTFNDIATCVWDLGGGHKVFMANHNCTIDGEAMGFACYNNPSEGNYIFRS
ncbi:MAG: hypothetical protein IKW10_03695 [Oscillospiraceae bacterium]|nr:hypothetical protein [Oscillospiraceae bacterium]